VSPGSWPDFAQNADYLHRRGKLVSWIPLVQITHLCRLGAVVATVWVLTCYRLVAGVPGAVIACAVSAGVFVFDEPFDGGQGVRVEAGQGQLGAHCLAWAAQPWLVPSASSRVAWAVRRRVRASRWWRTASRRAASASSRPRVVDGQGQVVAGGGQITRVHREQAGLVQVVAEASGVRWWRRRRGGREWPRTRWPCAAPAAPRAGASTPRRCRSGSGTGCRRADIGRRR
jgi:hypothetical protein